MEGEIRFTASDVPAGEWVRLEIPLSEFNLATSGSISQMIFSSRDVDGNASLDTVYVANAFLSVDEATPMDSGEGGEGHHEVMDPTEGPMSPELAATEGFAAATAWGNYYGGSGTAVSDVDLGGTTVKKYTNLDYAIAEGFSVDAGTAGLNTLHVDVWRLDDTADFGIKLVDYGSDGNWSGGDDVEGEIRFTASDVPAGEWVRLEIPLSEFNLATSGSISQMIFSSRDADGNASLDTVYVANAFLSVDEATPMDSGEGGEGFLGEGEGGEGFLGEGEGGEGLIDSPADLSLYNLTFEDTFDEIGNGPDSANWTFDTGSDGWGNNEVQDYQSDLDDAEIIDWDESSEVNGALRITAKNVDGTITSARVKSDIDVGAYGYYEVRAKLPSETGAWPAIWLLGEGGRSTWPNDGEIDLVEWSAAQAGSGRDIISALHYPAAHGGNANDTNATLTSDVDEWHIYQLWWTPDSIKIGVDGTEDDAHLVYEKPEGATNDTWPYDGPMDLILNIAIGGTLGGEVPTSNFEYAMDVDYVRIYQMDGMGVEVTDPTEGPMSPELAATEGFAAATAWGNYYGDKGTAVSDVDLGGTIVKKYTNLDYAVAEGFSVDAGTAGLNTLHVDVWRLDDTADFGIKLVDYGSDGNWSGGDDVEGKLRFTASDVPAGEWVRLEIPLSEFNLATSGSISQMIFSSRDVDGNASLDTVYVANAFLSVDEATPMDSGEGGEGHHEVTDPTEGPMSPELAATEGFAAATAWGNYYGGSGTAVSEVDLGGTTVKKYTNLDYAIAEGFSVDAGTAGLNTLHVDVWRLDDTADFGIKLVDYGSDKEIGVVATMWKANLFLLYCFGCPCR